MDHDFGTSPISSEQRQQIVSQAQQPIKNNTNKNAHKEQNQSDREKPIRSIIIDEDESGDEGIKDGSARNISKQHEQIIILSPDHNYMLGVDHHKGPNPVFPVIGGIEIAERDEYTHTKGHLIQKPMKRLPSDYNSFDGDHSSYYQMKIGKEAKCPSPCNCLNLLKQNDDEDEDKMDHDFGTSPISSEQRQQIVSQAQQPIKNNTNKNDHKEQNQSDRERPIRSIIIIDENESGDEGIKDGSARNISNQHEQIIMSPDTDHNYMLGVDHPKGPNPVFPVIGGLVIGERDEHTHTKGHLIQKAMKRLPSNYNPFDGDHRSYHRMKIGKKDLSTKSIPTLQQCKNWPFTQRQAIYKGLLPTLRPASRGRPPASAYGYYEGPASMITTPRGRVPEIKSRNVLRDSIEQPELGEDDGTTIKYSFPPSNVAQLHIQLRNPAQRRQNNRNYQTIRQQRERENEQQRQFEEQRKKYSEIEKGLNADLWEIGNLLTASKKRQRSPRKKPPDDLLLTPQQMLPEACSTESPRHSTFDISTIDATINAVVRGEASVMHQYFGPPPIITTSTSHLQHQQTHQQQQSTPYKLQIRQVPRKFDTSPPTQISHQRLDELAELANASANLLEYKYKHGEHEYEHNKHPAAKRRQESLHVPGDQQNMDQQEQMENDEEENELEGKENEPTEQQGDEMEEEDEEDESIAEQKEDKPIKEEEEKLLNEEEENADKILIEDIPIKQEAEEGPLKFESIENPFANSREEILKKKLANANEKVYKWMAGIEPNEIGQTIGDWDKLSLLKMVEMADHEIRELPQKLNLWIPWLKCAIPKCSPQIDGFKVRFRDLIKLTFN